MQRPASLEKEIKKENKVTNSHNIIISRIHPDHPRSFLTWTVCQGRWSS